MRLGGKTHGGPNIKAPGTEVSSGVLGQPSQTAPKDGSPPKEESDGNKAPLRKGSGNDVTPFFPLSSTPRASILSSARRTVTEGCGRWGFLEMQQRPPAPWLPLARTLISGGPTPSQPAEPSLPLANRFALFLVAPNDTGCVIFAQDPPWPVGCCFAALHPFPWRGTRQLCLAPAPPMQGGNSWRWGGQKRHLQLCWA